MAETNTTPAPSRTDIIAARIDAEGAKSMELRPLAGGASFIPENVGQMMELAKMMATARLGVREHLRDQPGLCLAICMQAVRWEMDPFAVANKSYAVNNQIAFESQLITAVVNTRAPIQGRLKTRFEGEGAARRCCASATFIGETEPTEVWSPPFGQILPKNSPLWKNDPDQQLAYYTKRLWARRECPEVLLGVYDVEEAQEMRDVTPAADAPPRPQRSTFTKEGRPAAQASQQQQATDVDPKTGEVIDAKADGFAGLTEDDQRWVAEQEAKINAMDSLGDLAEYQHNLPGFDVPKAAIELLDTAVVLRQRQITGATGKGR